MDPVRRQLRQRLELEQMLGATGLPRLNRLPPRKAVPAPEAPEPQAAPPSARREARGPAGQPPAAAATGDRTARRLAELEQRVLPCRSCRLCQGRSTVVFGEGNPHADVVFVGEAPGGEEDRQGRPFVGPAGRRLNDIITKGMGLRRSDVYIANVCKCRPPENRTPTPDEMAQCLPYLLEQLAAIRPKVIVALGACAAQGLLATTEAVGRLRGHTHQMQLEPMGEPTPVVVTYHPAYLLRNPSPDTRRKIWEDIQVAMKIAGIPVPRKK